ncbi:MAG: T9SS type A sorting domain-containing protein [Bacteroidetes bacterium]|nr:T9SS type A sorting domain-containing protein [Bacteroidota bacterium]
MKKIILFFLVLFSFQLRAQFAPAAGIDGTTAISADSSVIVSWATNCVVNRGRMDITNDTLGLASAGNDTNAIGKADIAPVSLGDGGSAILTFANPIKNGPGYDFAVFENSFTNSFLELAFVEVSSNGVDYYRFNAVSNTQTTIQVGSFDTLDCTRINNLAGKYRGLYGTPFDLEELGSILNLDVNNITHIKIIDVIGSITDSLASFDLNGNKINDPWNTPFPSSGFDLDAVGVINQNVGIEAFHISDIQISVFPNPILAGNSFNVNLNCKNGSIKNSKLINLLGEIVAFIDVKEGANLIPTSGLEKGIYFLSVETASANEIRKIVIQ